MEQDARFVKMLETPRLLHGTYKTIASPWPLIEAGSHTFKCFSTFSTLAYGECVNEFD